MKSSGIWRKKIDKGMELYIEGYLNGPLCTKCGTKLRYNKKEIEEGFFFKSKRFIVECNSCGSFHPYIQNIDSFTKDVAKNMKKLMRRSLGI